MMECMNLAGEWLVTLPDGTKARAKLPGTLDENGIGGPDRPEKQWNDGVKLGYAEDDFFGQAPISTRFTRKHTFTGPATWTRWLHLAETPGQGRMLITVERCRKLRLLVNGQEAAPVLPGTLTTPWRFETRALQQGENELCFVSDNSYPGWPAEAIIYSSAATDETQTNWNGLLGAMTLEEKPAVFLLNAWMVLSAGETACLRADVSVPEDWEGGEGELVFRCEALQKGEARLPVADLTPGVHTLCQQNVALTAEARKWELDGPALYGLEASLLIRSADGARWQDKIQRRIGLRTFGPDARGRLSLNGRRVLLRSEANCAAFPETGYPPMDVAAWRNLIRQYQRYGVNCLRFHSHCPPEAAFAAADELGMLMQPELSHWDPEHAFEAEASYAYYRQELIETLRLLAPHPSFVMLTLGNELHCNESGQARMTELLRAAKAFLPDRLYAWGSNAFYGRKGCDEESDFYTSQNFGSFQMRAISAGMDREHPGEKARIKGYLNNKYPDARTNYGEGMAALRRQVAVPMFSFEVGQYEVLPDFNELQQFHGVTEPVNLRIIQRRAEKKGLLSLWDRMVEASGELALIGYREEVEAVMRTPEMSGISLLSLQDFPGQGTALVGMMNAHLQPKSFSFAQPERFAAFFRDALPLLELEKYTFSAGERIRAALRSVNYGQQDLTGCLILELRDGKGACLTRMEIPGFKAPAGESVVERTLEMTLPAVVEPTSAEWVIYLKGQEERFINRIRIWIYPKEEAVENKCFLRAETVTEQVLSALEKGEKVLLEPPSTAEALPGSMQGQFSTDFWSVGTFPQQEGGMGLLIQSEHPLFQHFPTSFHTDYQWWLMAGQRALHLPDERWAEGIIVRQMDSYSQLRTLAMLLEARVGRGRLLISSMGLSSLPPKPEVRALQNAICRYMRSEDFQPAASMTPEELISLFQSE